MSPVSFRGAIWLPLAVQAASRQMCRSNVSPPAATVGHKVLSSTQIRHAAITATTILLQPAYQGAFIGNDPSGSVRASTRAPDAVAGPSGELPAAWESLGTFRPSNGKAFSPPVVSSENVAWCANTTSNYAGGDG